MSGPKRLMLAVLQDAIDTLVRNATVTEARGRRLLVATEAWFAAEDYDWPFSFVCICHALDLDPAQVRGSLASRRRERATAHGDPFPTWFGSARPIAREQWGSSL